MAAHLERREVDEERVALITAATHCRRQGQGGSCHGTS